MEDYRGKNAVVLGIPRGGVVIAQKLAESLECDLDIVLSHKIGAPGNPELAIGAVCEDGKLFVDKVISSYVSADNAYIEQEKTRQLQQMSERVRRCRDVLAKVPLKGRVVIIADDGVATGATIQAALWAVRKEEPAKLIAAVPVGPSDTMSKIAKDADETICLRMPQLFGAIGRFYLQFDQVEDEELMEILSSHSGRHP
jgi:predicted phosphoribosyltransferase